jgi:hypothetical protein
MVVLPKLSFMPFFELYCTESICNCKSLVLDITKYYDKSAKKR